MSKKSELFYVLFVLLSSILCKVGSLGLITTIEPVKLKKDKVDSVYVQYVLVLYFFKGKIKMQ